jgi:predicted secreted protein with PEFG-CTERM motif
MKIILALLLVSGIFSYAAFAQEIKIGEPAVQQVSIRISENGDAHVTHEVKKTKTPKQVEFLSPDFTNFTIIDDEGAEPMYAEAGGENPGIVLFPTNEDVIIEYDIEGIVQEKGGLWMWDYVYLADTSFFLPEGVDLFYVNENLVRLGDQKGFLCHGCQVKLEYELEPTILTKQLSWEGKTFDVKIITQTDISDLALDQPKKTISFDVTEPNKYVTLIIPRDLLWNPYEVSLNDKLILKQERVDSDNNVWLHIIPNETGTVTILGVSVVPEFPLAAVLVLSASMAAVLYVNRLNRH